MKPSIYSLTRQDMIDWAEENGEKEIPCSTNLGMALSQTRPVFRRNDQPF